MLTQLLTMTTTHKFPSQARDWKRFILTGPLYSIYVPYEVLKYSVKAAVCYQKEDVKAAAVFKLFEVVGEALPQVSTLC